MAILARARDAGALPPAVAGLAALWLAAGAAFAQEMRVDTWAIEDGLPQNSVTDIIWELVSGIRDRGKTVFLTTHLTRPRRSPGEDLSVIGQSIGPYQITAKLGEGGMGEVYRATDARLKRDVAIKVLPAAFTADPERLARFEREAQLPAQLQHPNIASIFGLEIPGGEQ